MRSEAIIVAFIPVLHKGYLDFMRRHPCRAIFLIDHTSLDTHQGITDKVKYISRELRAISTYDMKSVLEKLLGFDGPKVFVSDAEFLNKIGQHAQGVSHPYLKNVIGLQSIKRVIMPDEDISQEITRLYFEHFPVTFDSVFLRWDWGNVQKARDVDCPKTSTDFALGVLVKAIDESRISPDWWRQIGAVLVRDNQILMQAHNIHMPTPQSLYTNGDPRGPFAPGQNIDQSNAHHAEKQIIAMSARKGLSTEGAEIFVTTFPCPTCAMDIAIAGIKKVYFFEGYSALGALEILRSRGVEVVQIEKKPPQT